jgi:hypothetical protein
MMSDGTARRKLIFFLLEINAISLDTAALFLLTSGAKSGDIDEIKTDIIDYFARIR